MTIKACFHYSSFLRNFKPSTPHPMVFLYLCSSVAPPSRVKDQDDGQRSSWEEGKRKVFPQPEPGVFDLPSRQINDLLPFWPPKKFDCLRPSWLLYHVGWWCCRERSVVIKLALSSSKKSFACQKIRTAGLWKKPWRCRHTLASKGSFFGLYIRKSV